MNFSELGKLVLTVGIFLVFLGGFFLLLDKIPFLSRLPGDIHIQRENFDFHFPLMTCIILSVILTILFNIFFRK